MADTMGEINVRLGIDPTGVQQGAKAASNAMQSFTASTKSATQSVGAFAGVNGSASFAVISLGQGLQDAGQFGMGMAQGIRAVTNNVQMSVQAMMMLATQAGGATNAMKAFWTAMKGPAGFLLAFGAITALIEGIANATQGAARDIKKAMDDLIEVKNELGKFEVPGGESAAMAEFAKQQIDRLEGLRKATEFLRGERISPPAAEFVTAAMAMPFSAQDEERLQKFKKAYESIKPQADKYAEDAANLNFLANEMGAFGTTTGNVLPEIVVTGNTLSDGADSAKKFAEAIAEAANAFKNLSAAWPTMPVEEMESRMAEIEKSIRDGIEMGLSPSSATVQRLVDQWLAVADQIETKMGPMRAQIMGSLTVGAPDAQFAGLPDDDLARTLAGMEGLETSAMRVGRALSDGINQELERTQILLATMPISAIDQLSGAFGESVGQLLTFQGGFEDFGKNIIQALQNIAAEMITLIARQELLNALKKEEAATTGLIAGLSAGNIAGLGIALGAFGFASALFGRRPARQTASGIDYGRPMPRMAVEGVVLRSGDIEFSVAERRAVNARIGR